MVLTAHTILWIKAELLEEPAALIPTPCTAGLQGVEAVVPARTFGNFWRHFWLSQLAGVPIVVFSASKPGMLLNILPHTGQLPETKSNPVPNISSAKVKKACVHFSVCFMVLGQLSYCYRLNCVLSKFVC